jgi:hypothetical protein
MVVSTNRAIEDTAPLLGLGRPTLRALLTAIFDLDHVALKVRDAYHQLRICAESPDPGQAHLFHYHLDHWIFQMDAYIERCDTAFTKVVRAMGLATKQGWLARVRISS